MSKNQVFIAIFETAYWANLVQPAELIFLTQMLLLGNLCATLAEPASISFVYVYYQKSLILA